MSVRKVNTVHKRGLKHGRDTLWKVELFGWAGVVLGSNLQAWEVDAVCSGFCSLFAVAQVPVWESRMSIHQKAAAMGVEIKKDQAGRKFYITSKVLSNGEQYFYGEPKRGLTLNRFLSVAECRFELEEKLIQLATQNKGETA